MKDKLVLDSLEAMRALSDPRRLEMIKHLVESEMTAADLASALGEDKSKLYYHLGELEAQGLIEVVEERKKRNFIEKAYRATARYYAVDRSIFCREHGMDVFFGTVTSILDTTASDIYRLIESGVVDGESVDRVHQGHRRLQMTMEQRAEFSRRLEELIADFSHKDGGEPYLVSFLVYPQPGPHSGVDP